MCEEQVLVNWFSPELLCGASYTLPPPSSAHVLKVHMHEIL